MRHSMSTDSPNKTRPPSPFEVFRNEGPTRVPGQHFPHNDPLKPGRRSGPTEQRSINDTRAVIEHDAPERYPIALGSEKISQPAAETAAPVPDAAAVAEPVTIRVQTYSVNLAERIATVKAGQKEALDTLQQMGDGKLPTTAGTNSTKPDPQAE